jgi:hypothetical protein
VDDKSEDVIGRKDEWEPSHQAVALPEDQMW